MDPVTITIVAALAAGATAGITKVTTSAIEDAYAGLKRVITDRYHKAVPFVEAVQADPTSKPEQTVLARQLERIGAANDDQLKAAAQALLDALESLRSEPRVAAMFDFDQLRAARNFELDIEGINQVFRAREATFEGDFKAKVRQPAGGKSEKH
jgi:hypothetical protein